MLKEDAIEFEVHLEPADGPMVNHVIVVPDQIAQKFIQKKGAVRILCSIAGKEEFPCALNPRHGQHVIIASKQLIKKNRLEAGISFLISIRIDPHNGLLLPEELAEVLIQDEHASAVFEKLGDGHKRGLIYYISQAKSVDTRVKRSLEIMEKMKQRDSTN